MDKPAYFGITKRGPSGAPVIPRPRCVIWMSFVNVSNGIRTSVGGGWFNTQDVVTAYERAKQLGFVKDNYEVMAETTPFIPPFEQFLDKLLLSADEVQNAASVANDWMVALCDEERAKYIELLDRFEWSHGIIRRVSDKTVG